MLPALLGILGFRDIQIALCLSLFGERLGFREHACLISCGFGHRRLPGRIRSADRGIPLGFGSGNLRITPDANEKDVFELFDKYNLRMLTVIDEENRPIGTVTVDDVVSRLVSR